MSWFELNLDATRLERKPVVIFCRLVVPPAAEMKYTAVFPAATE